MASRIKRDMDIAQHCRRLADYHGGTDLHERLRSALDLQRVHRLELALADDGELPPELRD